MGRIKQLEEQLARERHYYSVIFKEAAELKAKVYGPIKNDELMKELATEFGQFLITMNVKCVDFEKKLYKTQTGMAPDILTESMEQMWDRFISSKSGVF